MCNGRVGEIQQINQILDSGDKMIDFTKREQLLIIALIIIMLIGLSYLIYSKNNHPRLDIDAYKKDTTPIKEVFAGDGEQEREKEPVFVIVHVSGAVKQPGVYELKEGSRVIDAVNMAGGMVEDSDPDAINLAKKLVDEEKIYVPRKNETITEQYIVETVETDNRININTADQRELESLPGIGPVLAQRIIDYRTRNGPFQSSQDIMKVSGIGASKYEDIKDMIRVK